MKNLKNVNDSIFSSSKTACTDEVEKSPKNQSLENTNDILFVPNRSLILSKKLVKITKDSKNSQIKKMPNKMSQFNNRDYLKGLEGINMEKWFQNRIKIINDEKNPKKIIYRLISDEKPKSKKSLLFASKEKGIYVIRNGEGVMARIRWNIFSNHFKVFDDKNNLIGEIIYNFNFKGMNGPTKFKIILPKSLCKKKSLSKIKNKKAVHKIENKMPVFNDFFKTYVLNFFNRKIIPNEKNMQVIYSEYKEDNNNILLQFAQSNQNEFILDYKYPFNNITAFTLGITALSSRTFCK